LPPAKDYIEDTVKWSRPMALTDRAIRTLKPKDKGYRLFDGAGLYLEIAPSGGRWWRFKYRFAGKEKRISLGVYPDIGLKDAREARDAARRLMAKGIDPAENRKAARGAHEGRQAGHLEIVAREWFGKFSKQWAASHANKVIRRMERDIFPWIGTRPVAEIAAPELLSVLRRIENRGAIETAHRALQSCGQVFLYAIATGHADRNVAGDLRGALPPAKEKHHASIVDPKAIGALLRAIDGYQGSLITQSALVLAPLVFVRPGELRRAEWPEIDLDKAEWRIPAERMKMRQAHIVPLPFVSTGTRERSTRTDSRAAPLHCVAGCTAPRLARSGTLLRTRSAVQTGATKQRCAVF
jgi:integrase